MHSVHVIGQTGDDDSLTALVRGAREGERGSMERLLARIRGTVRRWAARLIADPDDADDVAQDVLIALQQRVRQFAGDSEFSTWLYQVTRNAALSRIRRDARRESRLRANAALETAERIEPSPDGELDDEMLASLVVRHLAALPPRQREVLELADIVGLTPAEIAARLDIEPITVRTNLLKARRSMRSRILEHHPTLLEEYLS